MKKFNKLFFSVALLLICGVASADIIKPVSVTTTVVGDAGSSHLWLLDDNPNFGATPALSPTLDTGDTLAAGLTAEHAYGGSNHQESWTHNFAGTPQPVFTFDLSGGGDVTVGSILMWQYANSGGTVPNKNGNHTREFEVIFHTEAQGDSFDFDTETLSFDGVMERTQGVPATILGQHFGLDTPVDARYAALKIVSNYLNQPDVIIGGDRYGLGEVRFASEEIPEPATLALLGLGGLFMARRKRA